MGSEMCIRDRKEGYVKIYPNNSFEHEKVKFEIAYKLKKQGYKVFTECRISGGRVDLAVISPKADGYIIEVLKTESKERYEAKLDRYDINWTLVKVYCKDFDINSWDL